MLGPSGLRQVDAAARGRRARAADVRLDRLRRRRPRRRADPQARLRADVPGRPALRPPHRRPQRRLRPAAAPYADRAGRRPGRASCSSWSGLGGTPTGCPARCPAASGSGSPWPGRSPSSPGCCCSTSRCRPSTRRCASGWPATCARSCTPPAPPRCWSPTTTRRRSRVADRLAVMRDGRVVQYGAIDEVWRAPVDAETALFLGYARVLRGDAADRGAGRGRAARRARASPYAAPRWSSTRPDRSAATGRVRPARRRSRCGWWSTSTASARSTRWRRCGSRVSPGDEVRLRVDVTRLAGPADHAASLDPSLD